MLEAANRITTMLRHEFNSLAEFSERVSEDKRHLDDTKGTVEQAQKDKAEFDRSISYGADVGVMFTNRLEISPMGVVWRGQTFKLEDINRIRWSATRHSVNGIPTGTTYQIQFGTSRTTTSVDLRNTDTFTNFVDRLWRAVGVRLLIDYAQHLKQGGRLRLGDVVIEDTAVTVVRHHVFKANEPVKLGWHQVKVWVSDGNFMIGAQDDNRVYSALSYQSVDNVHVLEHMISIFFKNGKPNLSSILE
jgi:hypothetical protein